MYGVPAASIDYTALAYMRGTGIWQFTVAVILLLDPSKVNSVALLVAAGACLLITAQLEPVQQPKGPLVAWTLVLAGLGTFAVQTGSVSPWVSAALYLANGLQFHFFPKRTSETYKVGVPVSELGYSMFTLHGGAMLVSAVYLGCLAAGLSQPQAFAAAFVVNGALAAKYSITDADKVGASKTGPLGWTAISAVLAGLALK